MNANHEGTRKLLLPTRCSLFGVSNHEWAVEVNATGIQSIGAADLPLLNDVTGETQNFPLPIPIGLTTLRHIQERSPRIPRLKASRLHRLPLSTSHKSRISLKASVRNMPREEHLHQIRVSEEFWDNLVNYTKEHNAVNQVNVSTFNINNIIGSRINQLKGVLGQLSWYLWRTFIGRSQVVNSEIEVQVFIKSEFINFANDQFRIRYPNQISEIGDERWPIGEEVPVAPTDAFMPVWGRPVAASHRDAKSTSTTPGKAGYPDFLLYYAPAWKKQCAIIEVKTPWAYQRSYIDFIANGKILTDDNRGFHVPLPEGEEIPGAGGGYFDWRLNSGIASLVKQIWSELVFFDVKWGMWTNGKDAFAFVRTGTYDANVNGSCNQLTISEVKSMQDEDNFHLGFLGLCFASIDERLIGNEPALDLVSELCPFNSRQVPGQ